MVAVVGEGRPGRAQRAKILLTKEINFC